MAQIQEYGKRIAPPESTGEVLDTQSVALQAQKASAMTSGIRNAGNAVMELGNTFAKLGAINQQAKYTEAIDSYDREWQKISNMINATPTAVGSWAPDEEGNRGDLLNRWHENMMTKYGSDLKGRYADEFAHQTNQRVLAADAKLGEFSLTRQRDGIAANDMTFVDNLINNPDVSNPERWLDDAMGQIEDRYRMSFNSGVYTETQVAEGMIKAQSAAMQNVYKKITADIQDSDGWNHPINPRMGEDGQPAPYIGLNGALDFIADQEEAGKLNPGQAAQMVAQVDEQDKIRASRGTSVQREKSMDYTQEWMKAILVDGARPTYDQLLNDPRVNSETTDNYYRNGDNAAAKFITGLLDDALDPGGEDFKWDWEAVQRYAYSQTGTVEGSRAFYELFHDASLDKVDYHQRVVAMGDAYGMSPDGVQWMLDRSRDSITNDNYIFARKEVEGFYETAMDGAKNEEERIELEALMMRDVGGILEAIGDPDVATRADIVDVLANYKNRKIGETIFKEFVNPERNKLNAAEVVLSDMETGGYRGLTYIPRFADEAARVGEIHRQMVTQIYGEEGVMQMRWGDKGTNEEGRVAFQVKDWNDTDMNGQPKMKWIQYRMEGTEEAPWEFDPNAYDDKVGEVWSPAAAPMLQEQEAGRDAAVDDERGIIRHLVETQGADYNKLLSEGYSALAIQEAFGTGLVDVPGAPGYRGPGGEIQSYYLRNVANGQIPYSALASQVQSQGLDDASSQEFFDYVFDEQKDLIKNTLLDLEEKGEINIQNNRGGRREIANRVLAREIAKFGLSRSYLDPVYDYVYGGTE